MSTATVQQTCPDWCNKVHRLADTSDPSRGIVHACTELKVRTSDPVNGDAAMTVLAERYPSGQTEVVVLGPDESMALSPVHALALAAVLQTVAGPLVDLTGAVLSTRPA